MATITTAAIQAMMKLRIVVRPLGSLSKVRYRNFRDKRRPSARAAGYQVRITRTLVCRSAGGLCSGSKSTLPHEVEGAPLMRLIGCAVLIGLVLAIAPAQAQLSGHGGPIRGLAISADGATALSGSFDTSAIRWLLRRNTARTGVALASERSKCGRDSRRRSRHNRR